MSPLPTSSAPSGAALVSILGWVCIVIGLLGLPISLISGAMVITRSHGTQHAEAFGLLTVVLGPAAVLACGIGLLKHWSWAWWGAVLLAALVFSFSLKAYLKPAAPPVSYQSESGTVTTVYTSPGGLIPVLLSGGLLALLLLPSVRAQFRQTKPTGPAPAPAAAPTATAPASRAPDAESAAIQREILAALRSGAEFRTAHKEGGTIIRWRKGRFLREDYGDWSRRESYTNEAAFLAFLWEFFEWQSRGFQREDIPEPERWRNIQKLLYHGRTFMGSHGVLAGIGAFVIAAAAVGLMVWLFGGPRYFHRHPHGNAPQKLDTFDGKPPPVSAEFTIPHGGRKG